MIKEIRITQIEQLMPLCSEQDYRPDLKRNRSRFLYRGSDGKESACDAGDLSLIPGSGRSSGEGNGNPLQCSCLENPMDRGPWQATYSPWGHKRVRHNLTAKQQKQQLLLGLSQVRNRFPHLGFIIPSCGLPRWLSGKESACNAGFTGDTDSMPGLGRSLGGGNGNPLQCSCLENPMDRGA